MAQYRTGKVFVTNANALIFGNVDTDWTSIVAGNWFALQGVGVTYTVASVTLRSIGYFTAYSSGTTYSKCARVSYSGKVYGSKLDTNLNRQPDINPTYWEELSMWEAQLSAPWAGTTTPSAVYGIVRDFTSLYGLPLPAAGDVEVAALISRGLNQLDGLIGSGGFAADTRRSVAVVPDASTGDAYGMEQVSAAQTGDAKALRLFTSALGSSYLAFGKYTNTTAFTEYGRFDASGVFTLKSNTMKLGATFATTLTSSATAARNLTLPDATGTLLYSGGPLGTPASGVATNLTGTAAGLTAGNVITNANLTGGVTSVGNVATVVTNANLSGDVTSVGNATTLATVNANVGSFGSSANIPVITVNAKGLITAVSIVAASAAAGSLTGTTLAANVLSSSLTSLGTIASLVATSAAIGSLTLTNALGIAYGGTGATSATAALTALLPSQTGNAGKVLSTNGSVTSWISASGTGTVSSFSFTNANGISGVVTSPTAAPNLTLSLGAITPTSVTSSGDITLSSTTGNLYFTGASYGKIQSTVSDLYLIAVTGSTKIYGQVGGSIITTTSSSGFNVAGVISSLASNGVNVFESPGISSVGLQFRTNSANRFKLETPSASADLVAYYNGTTEVMRLGSASVAVTGTLSATGLISGTAQAVSNFNHASGTYSRWQVGGANRGIIGSANNVFGGSTDDFAICTENVGRVLIGSNNSAILEVSTTGLAVTGALSATGTISMGNASTLSWGGAYGAGTPAIIGSTGSGELQFRPTGSTSGTIATVSATGLAVTGALSATGNINVGVNLGFNGGVNEAIAYSASAIKTYIGGTPITAVSSTGLAVTGAGAFSSTLGVNGMSPAGYSTIFGVQTTSDSNPIFVFRNVGTGTQRGLYGTVNNSTGDVSLDATGAANGALVLKSGGTEILRVKGDASGIAVTGTLSATGLISSSAQFASSFDHANGTYSRWKVGGVNKGIIGSANNLYGGSSGDFGINTEANNNLTLGVNSTPIATISSTGVAVTGALSASGNGKFGTADVYVGNGVSTGLYGDGGNVAVRAYAGGSSIYFQNQSGAATLGLMNTTAFTLYIPVLTPASSTSSTGLRLPHGSAPTSPANGDVWTTTSGMYVRINGATVGPFGAGGGTVSSVSISGSNGIGVSGSPITTSGTITLSLGAITPSSIACSGAITATGNITAYYSDDRLKTRLGKLTDPLSKVCSLDGFYYEANHIAQAMGYERKREYGLSAQQVEKFLPELVAPAPIDNNYLTLRYERMAPLFVESFKEVKGYMDSRDLRIAELESRIIMLEKQLKFS